MLCPAAVGWGAGQSVPTQLGPGGVQTYAPPAPRRYLCCETQMELREWFATFLFMQVPGAGCRVWGGSGEASITKNGRVCSLVKPSVASGF